MRIFIIAEIGINHNGDIEIAKKLIDVAKEAGCDAVKFQKRDINLVYSKEMLDSPRESPWGHTQREQKQGLEIRRNMMAELRGDFTSRGAWYRTMREIGAYSVDDIMDLEDRPAVPGGKSRYASLNYVPLELFEELSINRNRAGKGG